MAAIYEPSGAAREYSPLALNYIKGCDHGCIYCLHPDTLVLLANGHSKQIKDISIGESIIGVDKHSVIKSWGHRYATTQVLAKIKTNKQAYKVTLENGTSVICSADHRWLTDRGWKFTIAHKNRPFLTKNNFIRGIGSAIETPKITDDYRLGYLSGMITGDGAMGIYDYSGKYQRKGKKAPQKNDVQYHFRLALKDTEALYRSKEFLNYFGITTTNFDFDNGDRGTLEAIRTHSKDQYIKIKKLIEYSSGEEWRRGWLAGIYDAEGSFSDVIRISNYDPEVNKITQKSFKELGFNAIIEDKGVRLTGGIEEMTKFIQLVAPAISRKFVINGQAVNKNIRVLSIEDTGEKIEMIDIMTGTENFIANGLISHNCYVPKMMKRFDAGYVHSNVYTKEEKKLLNEVTVSARKFRNSTKQVFLSFLTDPYSHFNNETKLTRRVLQILLDHRIPVSILSKGGSNVLQDLDMIKKFGPNIQVGGSLTFTNNEDSLKWEKNGALPYQRFEALQYLHEQGIKTWASMEPVIYPEQSLEIMEITKDYVDAYKIGKLNHFQKHEEKFDWKKFLTDAVAIMRKNNKRFYIKKDLLAYKEEGLYLSPEETDMDHLALTPGEWPQLQTTLL